MACFLWEIAWRFLKNLKPEPPYDPAIRFLGRDTKELKPGSPIDLCTPMFIAALFPIATRRKEPIPQWMRGETKYGVYIG